MSTPGSGPSGAASSPPESRRERIFRWQGIIPIALVLAIVIGGWLFFAEGLIRRAITQGGSAVLGTQVDVADLAIRIVSPSVEVRGFAVADPDDVRRNLVSVGRAFFELEALPLLQKKVVVRRVTVADVELGAPRAVPAKPVVRSDTGPNAFDELKRFAGRVKVPLLSLVPLDSLKAIALHPEQLKAVQAAVALGRQADSVKLAIDQAHASLNLQPTLDSSSALAARLQTTNIRTLGLDGARKAVADVRRAVAQVDSTRGRVERLVADAKRGVDSLQVLTRAIDDARREDYAMARGLLRLPSIDAPEIGAALFGAATIDRFEQVIYWAALARKYAPPGLLPKQSPGPKRVRMAGTTVHFVTPRSYPRFLLRRADVNVVGTGAVNADYALAASDLTSDPGLVGRPTLFVARRTPRGVPGDSLRIAGSLDHTRPVPRDVVTAYVGGVKLPPIALPMLPYTLDPGVGVSTLRFVLDGDRLSGTWSLRSGDVTWRPDSTRAKALNTMETLVARALTGINTLELTTDIGGTLSAPTLSVRSNLDRVIADRLRAVAGEAVAAAEAKARAQVDKFVNEKSEPVKARVAEIRADTERRVTDARTKLDVERKKLDERLKALSGGLNLPRVPTAAPD